MREYDNNGWLLAGYDLSNQVRLTGVLIVVVPVDKYDDTFNHFRMNRAVRSTKYDERLR